MTTPRTVRLYLSAALHFQVDDPEQLGDASRLQADELPFNPEDWDKLTPQMLRNVNNALITLSGLRLITAINGVKLPGAVVTAKELKISEAPFTQASQHG